MIGTTLSHFKITAKLGEGGMGEVYLAEDSKLGREVAIKVLPEAVASDPERLARFEREARVLASLNHPNIAGIHQTEEADGKQLLILELVEGEDLAERLARNPLTVEETLPVAKQITEALEAAHEQGIIHRDLKPANIKVKPDGQVKVLDFGLAKALDPESSVTGYSTPGGELSILSPNSPTLTQQMTQAGVVLGTAAYMSPEQAKGKAVDKRADIWAFGVVLFEMLVGRKLFEAESVPETLGALFQQEINLDDLPAGTPRRLRRLLDRCLDRDPKSRLRDIGEARLAIQTVLDREDQSDPTDERPSPPPSKPLAPLLLVAVLAGLLVGSLATWKLRPSPANRILKLQVPTENLRATRVQQPVISPDGTKVLVPEARGLMIRSLDALSGYWVPDSTGARFPCWSPDSQSIAFVMDVEIRKASVEGGTPQPVAKLPNDVGGSGGMMWTRDNHILVAGGDRSGILQVSVQGGDFKEIAPLDRDLEVDFHEIALLPDGKGIAYILHRKAPAGQDRLVDSIGIFSAGERKEVLRVEGESILSIAYSPPGFLLFHQSTDTVGVWALPFSLQSMEATGEPFLVAADSWLPSASDEGELLLVHGLTESLSEVVEVDRQGNLLRTIAQIQGDGQTPHLSPDNSRLAVNDLEGGNWDVWIYDLDRGTRTRLTWDPTYDSWPRWSPSGEEILYTAADARELRIRRVDGTGETRIVGSGVAPDWIPDGTGFLFEHYSDDTGSWDISYRLFSEDEAVPLFATPANESSPRLSPDGRHLLYMSGETGSWEVYAQTFPDGEKKWQVSTNGGFQPQWSPTGMEIFYIEGDSLMAVELVDSEAFTLGQPTQILEDSLTLSNFDPSRYSPVTPGPGGKSLFLVRAIPDADTPNRLMLIQNWYEEFARSDV